MKRATMGLLLSVAPLLLAAAVGGETIVYWVPAPELLPQVQSLPGSPTWGDVDRDGDDDLSNSSQQIWRDGTCPGLPLWRSGSGALPSCSGCSYRQTALGDLDADGDLDVVYGCFEPNLRMFWNVGTPQVPQWHEDSSSVQGMGGYYSSPFLEDLDDDGDLDMLMVTTSAAVGLYENIGTPEVPAWEWAGFIDGVTVGASSPRAVLADLDGDGDLDIIGADVFSRVKAWENVGTPQHGEFVRNYPMLTGVDQSTFGWTILALPDVDCDGDPDMLLQRLGDSARFLYLNETVTSVSRVSWGVIKALYR